MDSVRGEKLFEWLFCLASLCGREGGSYVEGAGQLFGGVGRRGGNPVLIGTLKQKLVIF